MNGGGRAAMGTVMWVSVAVWRWPNLHHGEWAEALVLLAALVLMPLVIEIADDSRRVAAARQCLGWAARCQFPSAVLLVGSFVMEPGGWSLVAGAGWAGVLLMMAGSGAVQLWRNRRVGPVEMCNEAGLVFAAVGAAWLLAHRAGLRPLGFSDDIVLLTAVHFHYAGLILPVLAARALNAVARGWITTLISLAVMAGVPAVAVGITATQLGWGASVEMLAALLMSAAGAAIAVVHVRLGLGMRRTVFVRCLWVAAGCSLFAGMMLSALYGVRGFFAPWPWLDIPWMRALHGTINAIGFAGCGTLAWWIGLRGKRQDKALDA